MEKPLHNPEVLRRCRKNARLSQDALAVLAGLSRPTVARAELGQRITLEALGAMAEAMDCNTADLLTDEARKKFAIFVSTY